MRGENGRGHLLLLGAALLIAYLNSFQGAFQFDDYNVIVRNAAVHSWRGWFADLTGGGIRPLLKLTYTINWTCGLGLPGFHLVNLLIHGANSILVYLLAVRLLPRDGADGSGEWVTAPLIATLLFALHPVQTEAVTYICGRSTSLMATFYLGSILAYLAGREGGSRVLLHLISPCLWVMAILCKETAVTLPAALLLLEWYLAGDGRGWKGAAGRQAPHWLLLIGVMAALLLHPNYGGLMAFSFGVRSIHDNLLSQINGIWYLVSRLFYPAGLSIDPQIPLATGWTPLLAVKGALLAAALLAGHLNRRRKPWLNLALLWFFIHLLPTNSLVPRLDPANERQLYLASWGLFLAVGIALEEGLRGEGRWRAAAIRLGWGLTALALVSLTAARNRVYRSEIALWEDTVRHSPAKARPYNNLGYAYFLSGRLDDARRAYLEALRLDPAYSRARNNLAVTEAAMMSGGR